MDLGELQGPVLIFGGPYSNLQACEALLAAARARRIPTRNMISTGDTVAYCADPELTVRWMMKHQINSVMGNCEESFGFAQTDCGCGFSAGSACDVLSKSWYDYAGERLGVQARAWMRACPRTLRFTLNGQKFQVIHGAREQISRFIFASEAAGVKKREFDQAAAEIIVVGHCGLPFVQRFGDRLWVNPGVIGMPANDGTPRVWYGLLHGEGQGIRVEIKSLCYDHSEAARRMVQAGLPAGYVRALETGLWPSLDILPPAEAAATGKALAEREFAFAVQQAVFAAS